METIIQRIERLVDEKRLKDKDFCESAGITQSTYSTWKQRGNNPKSELIPQIAKALDVTKSYLLTGQEGVVEQDEFSELSDVYLSLAKEAQKNAIDPEDILMAIKMIKDIRDKENHK